MLIPSLHDGKLNSELFGLDAASVDPSLDLRTFILYASGLFKCLVATLQLLVGLHDGKDAELLRLKNRETSGAELVLDLNRVLDVSDRATEALIGIVQPCELVA